MAKIIGRSPGPTLQCHVFNFAWNVPQPSYLRPSQATAQETTYKSYKYLPPPSLQGMENWSKSNVKRSTPHIFRK